MNKVSYVMLEIAIQTIVVIGITAVILILAHKNHNKLNILLETTRPIKTEVPVYKEPDMSIVLAGFDKIESTIKRQESVTNMKFKVATISLEKEFQELRSLIKSTKTDLRLMGDKLIKLELIATEKLEPVQITPKICKCTTYCTCGCN